MISKSKYVNSINCLKHPWLELHNISCEEENTLGAEYGNIVGKYARDYFGKHVNIERTTNKEMAEATKKLLKEENIVITEASFIYEDLFCSVDILVKHGNNYEIYEVKSKKEPNDKELEKFINDISFQYYVLTKNNLKVTSTYLMGLNPTYIKQGPINLKELFIINDLTKEILSHQTDIEMNINLLRNYLLQDKEPYKELSINCNNCPYFKYCSKDLPKNNIFELNSRLTFSKKISMYQSGIIKKKDALNYGLNPNVIEQINHDIKDLPDHIIPSKLKKYLSSIKQPVYYLDFETFSNPIPIYDGDSVNEVIPFQYSLHYYKNDTLLHTDFLGDGITDPRRQLAEKLLKDIPTNVTVIAYHKSVECGIIKKLASRFKDLSEDLLKIANNIIDLEEPFAKRYFYTKAMNGRSSIKVILPALCSDLNYNSLEGVHKGDEATNAYLSLKNLSKEESEKIRNQLLTYCELDTYAMVRIHEELIKKITK